MSEDQGVPEEQDAVRRLRKAPPPTSAAAPAAPAKRAPAKRAPARRTAPAKQPVAAEPVVAKSVAAEPEAAPAPQAEAEPTPTTAPKTRARPRPLPGPQPAPRSQPQPAPPPEPTSAPVASAPARVAGLDVRAAVAMLVLLAVVSAALLAVSTHRLSDRQAAAGAGEAALSAATSGVQTVLSYNYKTLTSDFAHAGSVLTPSFRKLYDATTAKGVEPLAAKYKAVSSAQVSAGGVVSASVGHAEVLVFVAQQVTNSQLAAPRLDRSRIRVDLVKSGDRWLIDKLTPV